MAGKVLEVLNRVLSDVASFVKTISTTIDMGRSLNIVGEVLAYIDELLENRPHGEFEVIYNYILDSIISTSVVLGSYLYYKIGKEPPKEILSRYIKNICSILPLDQLLPTKLRTTKLLVPYFTFRGMIDEALELFRRGEISFEQYRHRIDSIRQESSGALQDLLETLNKIQRLMNELWRRGKSTIDTTLHGMWRGIINRLATIYAETIAVVFIYDTIVLRRHIVEDENKEIITIYNANPCFEVWLDIPIKPLAYITKERHMMRKEFYLEAKRYEVELGIRLLEGAHIGRKYCLPPLRLYRQSPLSILGITIYRPHPNENKFRFNAVLHDFFSARIVQFSTSQDIIPEHLQDYIHDIVNIIMAPKAKYDDLLGLSEVFTRSILPRELRRLIGYFYRDIGGVIIFVLPIDDVSLHMIPWELINMDGKLLATAIPIIRQALWEMPYNYMIGRYEYQPKKPNILLLGNLTGDLPSAENEIIALSELFGSGAYSGIFGGVYSLSKRIFENIERSYIVSPKLSVARMFINPETRIIHIASHVDIDNKGIYLPLMLGGKEDRYYLHDLFKVIMHGSLLFINSCIERQKVLSMDAMYHLLSIVSKNPDVLSGIVFPISKVFDDIAKEFSISFYRSLLDDTFGSALYRTRALMFNKYREGLLRSLNWLSYTAYGNPFLSLISTKIEKKNRKNMDIAIREPIAKWYL